MSVWRVAGWLAAGCLFASGMPAWAEDVPMPTSHTSPSGDYETLAVMRTLTGAPSGASLIGDVALEDDGTQACTGGHQGGTLTVSGDLDVQNSSGQSILFADASTGWVGMGTRTPRATLEVAGNAMANILSAHTMSRSDFLLPWAQVYGNHVEGVIVASGGYRRVIFHFEGNPLVLQSISKQQAGGSPLPIGSGYGRVLIKVEYPSPDPYAASIVLVVGTPFDGSVARAYEWRTSSSRAFKTDIQALAGMEYAARLAGLAATDVVRFRGKQEPEGPSRHLGFIAEDVPAEMAGEDRKTLNLAETVGYLLAAAKGLQEEHAQLRQELEALQP